MKKILLFLIMSFMSLSIVNAEVNLTTGKTQVHFKYKFEDQPYSDLKTTFFKTGTAGESLYLKNEFLISFSDNSSSTSAEKGITLYGRYALCMDGGFTGGWNQSNADDVWFRKTNIPCNYYGSSYTGGTITFATFEMTNFEVEYFDDGALGIDGFYQYKGTTEIGTYLTTNNSVNFLGFDISNTPFPVYSTEDYIIKQNDQILTTYNTQIEKQDEIKQEQEKTNQELGELNDNLTNSDSPDGMDSLGSASGWLPPGPVDSLLTLPLSMLNNISTSLGSTCKPIDLPIPFVNKNLTMPCLNTIYSQISGLGVFLNSIGTIAAGFMLYYYFKKLYAYIDNLLSLKNNGEGWGDV